MIVSSSVDGVTSQGLVEIQRNLQEASPDAIVVPPQVLKPGLFMGVTYGALFGGIVVLLLVDGAILFLQIR